MYKIKDEKRYIGTLVLLLSSLLYFFLAYKANLKLLKNLTEYEKLSGLIVDKGIDFRYGTRGRKSKCFYIYLDNLRNQKLGVYRFSKNYSDLQASLNVDDSVTVYFIDKPDKGENINIDLVQIEKSNLIVLPKQEYDNKEKRFFILMIIVGLVSVLLSYLYFTHKIFKK